MMLFQLCGADCTQPKSPPLLNGRPFVLVFIAFLVNNVEKWGKSLEDWEEMFTFARLFGCEN